MPAKPKPKPQAAPETLSFEDAFQELDDLVRQLEDGSLTLDDSLALFERGQALAARCQTLLETAELKVQQLAPRPGGGYDLEPFEPRRLGRMSHFFADLFGNRVLMAGIIAWTLAQVIKLPLNYVLRREWDWGLLIAAGGMPSSHSALVTGVSVGIGLQEGFGSPLFAIAGIVAMIVIYDATGVRRHAGDHARVLNLMIDELLTGHPLAEKELKEVLGHTPREVLAGMLLGMLLAYVMVRVV